MFVNPPNDKHLQALKQSRTTTRQDPLSAQTGKQLRMMIGGMLAVLLVGFSLITIKRVTFEHRLSEDAKAQAAAPTAVEATLARATPPGQPLVLPGETAAWYESTIYARVNGYVGNWSADIGDHVARGQLLATIETPELDAALVAAKAKLRATEAEVKVRQAHAEFADTTYTRWRDSPKGVVSEQEKADKKAQFESAQAELTAAQAQVNVDQAEVDRLNSFEQFKQVTAPFDGTITERRIDIGNLVSAGSSAQTTPLYRISQAETIRVFVNVPQSAVHDLMKVGTAAEVTSDDGAGYRRASVIARTSEAIDPKARTFRVEIDLPNPDRALLPGLYVQVAFQLPNNGTVQVPASAMLFRSEGPQVAIISADGAIRFKSVAIARDDGNFVELSSGVSDGDKVVLNANNQIVEGEQVQVAAIDGQPVTNK